MYLSTKTANEESYGVPLNERTVSSPEWPGPQTDNRMTMNIPKQLNVGDRFSVHGKLKPSPNWLKLSLMAGGNYGPDETNVPLEMEVRFEPNAENSDKIFLKAIRNGTEEYFTDRSNPPSGYISGDELTVIVDVQDEKSVAVIVGTSIIDYVTLSYHINSIRYLVLAGDIEKLERLEFFYA